MANPISLTLAPGFTGNIRVTADGLTVRPLADSPSSDAANAPDTARISHTLDRFARRTPEVRDMFAGLDQQGWAAIPADPTKAAENHEYLRMLYIGRSQRVSLYLNTCNIVCAAVAVRGYAATRPTADTRKNGNVYFYFDGSHGGTVATALDAAAALIAFADSSAE